MVAQGSSASAAQDAAAAGFLESCLQCDVLQALAVLAHADILPLRNADGTGAASSTC